MASDDTPGTRNDAAGELESIAKLLTAAGFDEAAELAFKAAANLDLTDAELQRGWGGPLNGQQGRKEAFAVLVQVTEPSAIVETGTFRGITTEWMAQSFKQPIYTCETDPRYFHQAKLKLAKFSQVYCELKDSRAFLRDLSSVLPGDRPVLYYLDAHWAEDLPLREEIEIILGSDAKAVVMIDDFAVPGDDGYRWDDYGPGKRLTLEIFEGTLATEAHIFFPSLSSNAETGAKRGCCVVTNNDALARKIAQSDSFRGHRWSDWKVAELRARLEEVERLNRDLRGELSQVRDAVGEHNRAFAAERAMLLEHHDTLIRQRALLERDTLSLSEANRTADVDAQRLRRQLDEANADAQRFRQELDEANRTAGADAQRLRQELDEANRIADADAQRLRRELDEANNATSVAREEVTRARDETLLAREETGRSREEAMRRAAELEEAAALRARMEEQSRLHQSRIQQLSEELENMQHETSSVRGSLRDRERQLEELVRQLKVMRAYVGIIE